LFFQAFFDTIKAMNKVAIILINYKDYARRFLKDCAESLSKINYPQDQFKIFIVDNESTEQTIDDIKELCPQAEIIANKENVGFGAGNNSGIEKAIEQGFEYFFLLNMDTVVDPDFLAEAMAVYKKDEQIGLLQSRLMLYNSPEQINSLGNLVHYLGFGFSSCYKENFAHKRITKDFDEIIYPSGAALLISKKVLDDIDYFTPEFFMYHDDLEWGWKSKLLGYKNIIAYKSVVYHKFEFIKSIRQFYWMERNRLITTLVCYHWATLLLVFPAFWAMEFGLFIFSLLNGWWKQRIKVYKWFFNKQNIQLIKKWRKTVQKKRRVKERKVVWDFVGQIKYQEDFENPVLKYIANPLFNFYWQIVKYLIFW